MVKTQKNELKSQNMVKTQNDELKIIDVVITLTMS